MNESPTRRFRGDTTGDEGYILMLSTLLLVPLILISAFAIDLGSWYLQANRLQRAADAAALAGVIWQPDFGLAQAEALDIAGRNGFTNGVDDITITVTDIGDTQLRVEIVDNTVPTFFTQIIRPDITIGRASTAEYVRPIPMGSPENFLGNDPADSSMSQPNYWLATFGPNTNKGSGDRYHTYNNCGGADIGCSGGFNQEFEPDGYIYTTEVTALQGQPLNFEIFDPLHHNYGDHCTEEVGWLFNDASDNTWYQDNFEGPGAPLGESPPERFERGNTTWCSGDNGLNGNYTMTVIVREPDATAFTNTDNPIVCAVNFESLVPSDQADLVSRLLDNTPYGELALPFRDYFRNWITYCSIPSAAVQTGDYIIQIRTNADQSSPPYSYNNPDYSINTRGRNRYSLRTGFGDKDTNGVWSSGVTLAAEGRLPMFVNRPGGDGIPTTFHLARVGPQYAGQRLTLDFYDIGDGSALTVDVHPPSGTTFSNCSFDRIGNPTNPIPMYSSCGISVSSGYGNGDAMIALVDLPTDYSCNTADPFDCWVTVTMTFSKTPVDTTTWSAAVSGDPIHLIE
ncbi:MAG: hypothetical protein GY713_03235 [Actinomycetia bacterium]|nr:hypothetical protein [Actinomycetes bacterium]